MNKLAKEFIFSEKYRPMTIQECILPKAIKETFEGILEAQECPNLLLFGPSGTGKTTAAQALLQQLDREFVLIPASLDRNIDTLRNEITSFASSVSFKKGRKYIILDEADYLNKNSFQPALRNFMQDYSKNCGFILTCNYPTKLIDAIHSRCTVIDFSIPAEEKAFLASEFYSRLQTILKAEHITFKSKYLVELIGKHFPDFRKMIDIVQIAAIRGHKNISQSIIVDEKKLLTDLLTCLKKGDFKEIRTWVGENTNNNDISDLFIQFYDQCKDLFTEESIPNLIVLLSKYQYQSVFVASQEINFMAFLMEIMAQCEFSK